MLSEINCSLFKNGPVIFHEGLNIILGDDDAKNSIGKSSALMVIDFVYGGDSLLDDKAGIIKELGHHVYYFSFNFLGEKQFFSRATDTPDVVNICNKNYININKISIQKFREMLKEFYNLNECENSFRSLVSPFARIWGKETIDPDKPFITVNNEPAKTAVNRLIDLFNYSKLVSSEKKIVENLQQRKKTIVNFMKENIIPDISKRVYGDNEKILIKNNELIEKIKRDLGGALTVYDNLFEENLTKLQINKNELLVSRSAIQIKIKRLEKEIKGITPRLSANIALVKEFFPNVNVERLEEVEVFHQKISKIVKNQLKEELSSTIFEEIKLTEKIIDLEGSIQNALKSQGMPDDVFEKVFELKEQTDKAKVENSYFDQKKNTEEAIKNSTVRLDQTYSSIFLDIEDKINKRLKAFNKVVYGVKRSSSELRLKSASSYMFSSSSDTGTGKSYAGLIGFDLAILSSTYLPFVIHDSIIYKNIEIEATKRILRILSFIKTKQIFLSFDEAHKFGPYVEGLIKKYTVLKLSNDDLLYIKDWRNKK